MQRLLILGPLSVGLFMAAVMFLGLTKHREASDPYTLLHAVQRSVPLSGIEELDLLRHQDSQWYLDIATYGYKIDPGQSNVVFFPLYPGLIAGLSKLTGLHVAICAHVIGLLAYLGFCWFIAWFAGVYLADSPDVVKSDHLFPALAVLLAVVHPMAVIFHAGYPEPLFLCLLGLLFFALERHQYVLLLAAAYLLALTRPQGLFLPVAFIGYEALRSLFQRHWGFSKATGVVTLGAVAGVVTFMLVVQAYTGDATSFWTKRAAWDSDASLWNIPRLLLPVIGKSHALAKAVMYIALIGCLLLWRRGYGHMAAVFAAFAIVPLYQGHLGDYTRYSLLTLFAWVPVFAWLRQRPLALAVFTASMATFSGVFLIRWLDHVWVG